MKKSVLFVCIENSNRSQMAQAFANMFGHDLVNAYSAGSNPSGKINPKAIAAMKESGYDLTAHDSKPLTALPDMVFDYVITMGCGDECPFVIARNREDWDIPDPRDMNEADFNGVRDLIKGKVISLIQRLS
jgi:protein-tyrosine-phosphatase